MSNVITPIRSLTITGIDGFVGRHLARIAKEEGLYVRGVSRSAQIGTDLQKDVDEYFSADLTQGFPSEAMSDGIVHLAGLAAVGPSFAEPQKYIEANSAMVTQICEHILKSSLPARVIGVSTGAIYGPSEVGVPITEDHPILLSSPYVVSKLLVEQQLGYYQTRGINTVIARPFNHVGPGQGSGFLVPDLLARLRSRERDAPIQVGNLSTARDYLDVRDVARAYLALARSEVQGTFNIAAGQSSFGQEILEMVCNVAGTSVPETVPDRALFRPNDARTIVGSSSKLQAATGWKPSIPINQSIRDFVESQSLE